MLDQALEGDREAAEPRAEDEQGPRVIEPVLDVPADCRLVEPLSVDQPDAEGGVPEWGVGHDHVDSAGQGDVGPKAVVDVLEDLLQPHLRRRPRRLVLPDLSLGPVLEPYPVEEFRLQFLGRGELLSQFDDRVGVVGDFPLSVPVLLDGEAHQVPKCPLDFFGDAPTATVEILIVILVGQPGTKVPD